METTEIVEAVRRRRKELTAYLSELVAARTENPPGDEWRAAAVVEAFCKRRKIPCKKFQKAKGRTNIVAHVGPGVLRLPGPRGRTARQQGAALGPRYAVVCHLDTVPAGDGWRTDPFKAVVRGGKLYARGSKDNKSAMAAAMAAFEFLKDHEEKLSGQAVLVGAADEERGSRFGTHFLLDGRRLGRLDGAIVPDAGSHLETLTVAEKGLVFLKIVCHGQQAHGSCPEKGVNAIYPMAELTSWFRRWKMPGGENGIFVPATATRNVGVIAGGAAANVVPSRCEMQVDMRYLPGTTRDELLAAVSNTIGRLEAKFPGAWFEMETMMEDLPTAVPAESRLCAELSSAIERVTGRRPKPFGIGGATVSKQFVGLGIPAVGIGAGPDTAHMANEYMALDDLADLAAVMAVALWNLCGRK